MNDWMALVMATKKKHSCSLKEAMAIAKKIYVKSK